MQEIAIILSSFAGLATAAAIRRFPKNKTSLLTIGANTSIKNQIYSLKIEKDILTKTISRLYQHEAGLNQIQRDRLLTQYQHQLGVVLAKIEKLEETSKHPDLGPVGEGLITLMDQKLSQLDKRLYELSSKISIVNVQTSKHNQAEPKQIKKEPEKSHVTLEKVKETPQEKPVESLPQIQIRPRALEITTLTELPTKISGFPLFENTKKQEDKIEILQSSVSNFEKQDIKIEPTKVDEVQPKEKKPQFTHNLPEEENIEDEDDLDRIKGEIMKTLSKLEQAEVE
jgi:hypothetical protein